MTHWLEGPVLFLDVDGVLNSHAYVKRGGNLNCKTGGLDPEAVKLLQRIVDATGCALVLSSTWRILNSLAWMRGRLIEAGMRSPVPLRDKTPCLDTVKDVDTGLVIARIRGDEIRQWIEERDFKGRYVCLDDDSDFHPDQPLVQTSFDNGLTETHVARCIDILRPAQEMGVRCTCKDYPGADQFCTAHNVQAVCDRAAHLADVPTPLVPKGHFWRGEINPVYCKNCGGHYDSHLHTDEASLCPTSNQ